MQFTIRGIASTFARTYRRVPTDMVISETDIEAALDHLRRLPHRPSTPASWDRQRLLLLIRECIGNKPAIEQYNQIAPGLYTVIKPMGVDLANYGNPNHQSQVWLMIRSWGTDPDRITQL